MDWQGLSSCLPADGIVCFFFFFSLLGWAERAVLAAIDENQTPNV